MRVHRPLVRVVARDRSGSGLRHRLSRLAFGLPVGEDSIRRPTGTDTIYHFAPGTLFCVVWWRRGRRGRRGAQRWVLAVLEAPRTSGDGQTLPGIHPRAFVHAMVKQAGPAGEAGDVDRLLDLIRCMREHGIEPAGVHVSYWREAARRVMFGAELPDLPQVDAEDTQERTCDA